MPSRNDVGLCTAGAAAGAPAVRRAPAFTRVDFRDRVNVRSDANRNDGRGTLMTLMLAGATGRFMLTTRA
jgi:hypothetical protein